MLATLKSSPARPALTAGSSDFGVDPTSVMIVQRWAERTILPLRHEVALSELTRGLEGRLCRSRSSGRVLTPGLSCRALPVTAGCGAQGNAQGFPSHPGITGQGQAGRVNRVNLR